MSAGGSIGQAIMWKYGRYHVTLILSRFPLDEFIYDPATGENVDDIDNLSSDERTRLYHPPRGQFRPRISGQWGTMAMIIGPRITYAGFTALPRVPDWRGGERTEEMDFVGRKLHLAMMGKDSIASTKLCRSLSQWLAQLRAARLICLPDCTIV